MEGLTETLRKTIEMLLRSDLSGAASFVQAAANRGEVDAIYAMGDLYLKGIGVERSAARAVEYLTKAAEQGYSPAMLSLSRMYAEGEGVASNLPKALELCEAAAAAGDPKGFMVIGGIYLNGDYGASVDMDLGAAYLQKAMDANDADAPFQLGRLYLYGYGVPKNLKLAFQLCEKAADAGSVDGLYGLAYLSETGFEGYPQDLSRANAFYRKAARLGHQEAKTSLKRFPPVIKLGAIACSPGVGTMLRDADRGELIKRHESGNWGDVDALEWDRNDTALAKGQTVRSIHEAPDFAVVVQTMGNRSSSYMEFLNEDYSPQPVDFLESAERAVRVFNLMRTLHGWMQNS